ncbi:hypothetical protein LWI29_024409 [Acer saccharum]|uniref:Uncharacterized protein n=1 Tax=Acer saccharum TaxID=4024 RepID=A0AA39THS7_ACESA|nr:hypothetical protein LWI29_024409 [Acer saccharum]
MWKKSWLRQGYNRVVGVVGGRKKQEFPVLEGHPAAQEHAEVALETHESVQGKMKKLAKEFRIYRWNPDHPNSKPFLQSFYVDLSNCGPMAPSSILDVSAGAVVSISSAVSMVGHGSKVGRDSVSPLVSFAQPIVSSMVSVDELDDRVGLLFSRAAVEKFDFFFSLQNNAVSRFLFSAAKHRLKPPSSVLRRFDPSKRIQACSYMKSSRQSYGKPGGSPVMNVETKTPRLWSTYAIPAVLRDLRD